MRKLHVVALLDRPSPRSFGRVPFVQRSDKSLLITGLQDLDHKTLSEHDMEILIQRGDALRVDADIEGPDGVLAAGWLGAEFVERASELNAPPAPTPQESSARAVNDNGDLLGIFWVADPGSVYHLQMRWVKEAARLAILRENALLAELLEWVLPEAEETSAAILSTRATPQERDAELRWLARLKKGCWA